MEKAKIGFVGLGKMGKPMAANLARKGFALAVFNRTRAAAEALKAELDQDKIPIRIASSPRDAATGASFVVTMLADDPAVQQTVLGRGAYDGQGVIQGLGAGATHISMSTVSFELSESLASLHAASRQQYVAAPVFGRPDAAAAAKLWVVAAGSREIADGCAPLFEAVGQGTYYVGTRAALANVVKLAGNFMLVSAIEAFGEGLALVQKAGVEPELFRSIIADALFRSPLYANYGKLMVEKRFEPAGFKLQLGLKDMRLAHQAADIIQVPMPFLSVVRDRLVSSVARGEGEKDLSSLGLSAARDAGLQP